MTDNVVVKFNRRFDLYTAGETAGFTADKAKKLVDRGIAGYVDRQMRPMTEKAPKVELDDEDEEQEVKEAAPKTRKRERI